MLHVTSFAISQERKGGREDIRDMRFHGRQETKEKQETRGIKETRETRSSWLNCALRDDEAVHWTSKGHYEAVEVGN